MTAQSTCAPRPPRQRHTDSWLARTFLLIALAALSVHPVSAADATSAIANIGGAENAAQIEQRQRYRVQQLRTERSTVLSQAARQGLITQALTPDGRRIVLQRFVGNRPYYYIEHNVMAADSVSADEIKVGGSAGLTLTGISQVVGVWDGGNVRDTHNELTGRVINNDTSALSNHSTHVTGTILADGALAAAEGMAPGATARSWDFNDDVAEMILEQGSASPVRLSNHSYGFITGWVFNVFNDGLWAWFGDVAVSTVEDAGFGLYTQTAQDWDQIAFDSPEYVIVSSAGNDRNDAGPIPGSLHWQFDGNAGTFVLSTTTPPPDGGATGYDTLGGGGAIAKNVLSIGAVNDIVGGWTAPGDVVMSSFSGWGPADDGRIKPDLVANGVSLTSSISTADNAYGVSSGTSMSSPNTAGSIALLNEHGVNLFGAPLLAASMRALLMHTADEAGNPGPDYSFGWGMLNAQTAAAVMSEVAATGPTAEFHDNSLSNGATDGILFSAGASATEPVKVTIVWVDPPGSLPPNVVDPTDQILVNDLDIRLMDPNGGTHLPWVLDVNNPALAATRGDNTADPVEQIVIDNPVAGTYQLDISHKATLLNGLAQDYSVVITKPAGGNQAPVVDAGADAAVTLPNAANLDATVSDDGLPNGTLTTQWTQISGPGSANFSDATAVDTTVTFSLSGTYVLRLTADDTALASSDDVEITVSDPPINQPPVVDAGADQAITLPNPATLSGTVIDDGLPTGTLTSLWSTISGPGTVTYGDATSPTTSATFSVAGIYVLRLTGDDGALIAMDELTITVSDPVPNAAPSVDAGPDQTVVLPTAATLSGTAIDDGLPAGSTLTSTWSAIAGPGTVTFADANALATTATFSTDGVYTLRLTVSDSELQGTDDLIVTVDPSTRVTANLLALYGFEAGSGADVLDISGVATTVDLNIVDVANTTRTGDGGLSIDSSTRVQASVGAGKIFTAPVAANALTVEAWLVPAQIQGGPARAVTFSNNASNRNFTLGQNDDRWEMRLRTTTNGNNGTNVRLSSAVNSVSTGVLAHVVFTRDGAGSASLYIDGIQVDSASIGGDFSNWNSGYGFGLANEFS
ncbi:MAG: S8 family serine peptidase, partial [Pseudomonadota bacterium]